VIKTKSVGGGPVLKNLLGWKMNFSFQGGQKASRGPKAPTKGQSSEKVCSRDRKQKKAEKVCTTGVVETKKKIGARGGLQTQSKGAGDAPNSEPKSPRGMGSNEKMKKPCSVARTVFARPQWFQKKGNKKDPRG